MLTVEEIENVSFRRAGLGGYKIEDVDNFVDGVIEKVRQQELTNKELQTRLDQLSRKVVKYEQQAESVQDALITAEKTAKKQVKDAQAKADAIISEAQKKADAMLRESEEAAAKRTADSELRAQTIVDNALLRSAESIDENNRIIEQQKQHIIQIQSEVTRFRDALIESYKNHLRIINSLPKEEEFKQYQENLDQAYPAAAPITPGELEKDIKDVADKAVEQSKTDSSKITVDVLEPEKGQEISDEIRTGAKAKAQLEKEKQAEKAAQEKAAQEKAEAETPIEDGDKDDDGEEKVIVFKKITPTLKEQPDSNAEEIMAAANAAAQKKTDSEQTAASIDETDIFGTDEKDQKDKE